MNIASRVLKNFLSLSAAVFVHSAVAVISTVYLARVLGPEGFGRINFAFAFVQFFLILSAMGLDTVGVREVARNKDKVKHYVGNIISLKLLFAFGFFLILLAAIPFMGRPLETSRLVILYGFVLFPSALFFEWTWQGLERMGNIGVSKVIRQGLYLLLIFILVKNREDINLVPAIFLGVNILYAITLYGIFRKDYGGVKLLFNQKDYKVLLKDSVPIGITLLMGVMIYSMNTVFLNFFRSDSEVGYYNAAFQVISFMLMLICVLFDALFPTLSSLYQTSKDKMEKLLNLSGKVLMIITLPVAVGGTILASRLMNLLYGNKYEEGVGGLQILIWVLVVVALNTVYARSFIAANMQNFHLKVVTLQTSTILILGLILIPPFGVMGAAIATLSAETVGLYFYHKGFTRIGSLRIHQTVIEPLIASLIMGAFLFLCSDWNFLLVIILGIAIYSITIYLLKGITADEMSWAMDRAFGRMERKVD